MTPPRWRWLLLLPVLWLACAPTSEPSSGTDGVEVGRRGESSWAGPFALQRPAPPLEPALRAWRASPGVDTALWLAQGFFPKRDWGGPSAQREPLVSATALRVSLSSTPSGAMELTTRGHVFRITSRDEESATSGGLEVPLSGVAVSGPRSFWKAHGGTARGTEWVTHRVQSYEVLEDTSRPWRSRVQVEVPPDITAVRDAGGCLEFQDASGVSLLRLGLPVARDASGRSRRGGARLQGVRAPRPEAPSRLELLGRTLRIEMDVELSGLEAPVVVAPGWSSTGDMEEPRYEHTATLLPDGRVLVAGGAFSERGQLRTTELYDPRTGTWSYTQGPMNEERANHTATLLTDGRVLVAGGRSNTAELYDPDTGTWSYTRGPMNERRNGHTATLLTDGRVLVAGGAFLETGQYSHTTELYDPRTGTWSYTQGPMNLGHNSHTATRLLDGRVLVAGDSHSELYHPDTGTWSFTQGQMKETREGHTATLLPNGRVLVAGGGTSSMPEFYDPVTGTWTSTGPMKQKRINHTATLLPDGQVLVTGGDDGAHAIFDNELYDPASGNWSTTSRLPALRTRHTATLMPGGKVLLVGGAYADRALAGATFYDPARGEWSASEPSRPSQSHSTVTVLPDSTVLVVDGQSAQVYDPDTGRWEVIDSPSPLVDHTATLLPDGQVLLVDGWLSWLYDPAARTWSSTTGSLHMFHADHTATLLPNGKVLVVGGSSTAELYEPSTGLWSVTQGEMKQVRSHHTATLLLDGRVLVSGGLSGPFASNAILSSAELYDPLTDSWTLLPSRMVHRRERHTATLLPNGRVLVAGGANEGKAIVSSTELYDPSTGSWTAHSPMKAVRSSHSATLLPMGQVLVAGGCGGEGCYAYNSCVERDCLDSVELYDPSTGEWSQARSMSRIRMAHGTALLPKGRLLVVGGQIDTSISTPTAEAWGVHVEDDARRPRIGQVTPAAPEPGDEVTVQGLNFLGLSEASSGNSRSSATNVPILTLRSLENGQWFPLVGRGFSDNAVTAKLPVLFKGYYLLSVTTHALTASKVVLLENTRPPETSLVSTPQRVTRERSASFSFSSDDIDRHAFECSLEGGPFTLCSSPQGYSSLQNGPHTFQVRARDIASNIDPTPATFSWSVDTQPPDTQLESFPAPVTRDSRVSLSFSSSDTTASFECSLNGEAFSPCLNPISYELMKDERYTFQVRAVDPAGNVDPTTAAASWLADRTPPRTTLVSFPEQVTRGASDSFGFTSSEPGGAWECSLDGAAFAQCITPTSYSSLSEGPHSFQVRAVDSAGNVDPEPVVHAWRVDTQAPVPSLLQPAPGETLLTSTPRFAGSTEPGTTVTLFVDGLEVGTAQADERGDWSLTPSTPLAWGAHEVSLRSIDVLGNTGDFPGQLSFSTSRQGYYGYGLGCAASPSSGSGGWPLLLLLLGVSRWARARGRLH